jgi:hypothetical protein
MEIKQEAQEILDRVSIDIMAGKYLDDEEF